MKAARSSAEVLPPDVPVYRSVVAARTAHASQTPFQQKHGATRQAAVTKPIKGWIVWAVFRDTLVGCTAYCKRWVIIERHRLSTA